jgi:hypothetical protein
MLQKRYLGQAWNSTKLARHTVGQVKFSLAETNLDEQTIEQLSQQALTHQAPTVVAVPTDGGASPYQTLVAPVVLQNITIGDLQLYDTDPNRQWTESDLALVNTILDQVAQTAENIRLFEETRERAGREQTIREITDRMRAATSLEELVKTTAQELGERLSAGRAVVALGLESETQDPISVSKRSMIKKSSNIIKGA